MRDREPYDYDDVPEAEVLRALDPTEHNMERLNRVGYGAGVVFQTARVRGRLDRAAVAAAVAGLARHDAVRARVVRGPDGQLGFALGDVRPELRWIDDDAGTWPAHVEEAMNASAIPSHRGSAFRATVVGGGDDHAITLAAPHHLWDGVSSVALVRELLGQIARPEARPPVALRAVASPFGGQASDDQRARLHAAVRDGDAPALEALETELLAGPWCAELLDVQRRLVELERAGRTVQAIVPDEDPGAPPARARRVTTGLAIDAIGEEVVTPLARAARARGLTMHGALGGAVLLAHAARHWAHTGVPDGPQVFSIASPVNLRTQFAPPLADDDVRMAVDVALTLIEVGPQDGLWDVAARFGAAVTHDVTRRRALGSWFRTERRAAELPLAGVPIPLLSNVGRVAEIDLPGLVLVGLHACMATHSMFQISTLVQTLGGAVNVCYYHELPTVSRASMARFAGAVRDALEHAARG